MREDTRFFNLNVGNSWPGRYSAGIEVEEGVLRLATLPGDAAAVGRQIGPAEGWTGPSGLCADGEGNLYVSDPAGHQVLKVDGCDGSITPLGGLQGPGQQPGQLHTPRGLALGPRGVLYIAESGNRRLQVIDVQTGQVRGVWGQTDPWAPPVASTEPGRFQQSWSVCVDSQGGVYVADPGLQRRDGNWRGGQIQKFDPDGRSDGAFAIAMRAHRPGAPIAVIVAAMAPSSRSPEQLVVLDAQPVRVLIYHLDGSIDEQATAALARVGEMLAELASQPTPWAIAFVAGRLYVAEASTRGLYVFDASGAFIGVAGTYGRPISALAVDCERNLLLHASGGPVQRMPTAGRFTDEGFFIASPLDGGREATRWHDLTLRHDASGESAHFQLFTFSTNKDYTSEPEGRPSLPTSSTMTASPELTALDAWRAAPVDAAAALALNKPGRYLWAAIALQGDGTASPLLRQLRVSYDHRGLIEFLPALYRQDEPSPDSLSARLNPVNQQTPSANKFLERSLALFESMLLDEKRRVDDLPLLFDPRAAPADGAPNSWLDWLSGWLAFPLEEAWEDLQKRTALANAFDLYASRGTVEGLKRLISLYGEVTTVRIEEPAQSASLWVLGEGNALGADTMLAPAEADGAIVGTTATLGLSHLIEEADYGAPLFEDVAHRFCVQVYASELRDESGIQRLEQLIEREKPAHTSAHLCRIEPLMRVGFQARVGIDSIVGGPLPNLVLGGPGELGIESALPPSPRGMLGVVGQTTIPSPFPI